MTLLSQLAAPSGDREHCDDQHQEGIIKRTIPAAPADRRRAFPGLRT
jgi:hypothetical protein